MYMTYVLFQLPSFYVRLYWLNVNFKLIDIETKKKFCCMLEVMTYIDARKGFLVIGHLQCNCVFHNALPANFLVNLQGAKGYCSCLVQNWMGVRLTA